MNRETLAFVVYILHACARKWSMSPAEVYRTLEREGCVSGFLIPLQDILHTQSTDFVVRDVQEYMANRGVQL